MTYSHSQANLFETESTSSPDQLPVSPSRKPDSEKVQTMSGISFQSFYEWFKKSNPHGFVWKMFLDSLISRMDEYSRPITHHWKVKATPFKRYVFQLQPSGPRIGGTGSGLLLTPRANENIQDIEKFKARMEKYPNGTTMPNLATQISAMLPMPRANDPEKRGNFDATNPRNGLPGSIAMIPTPRSADGEKNVRTASGAEKELARGHGPDLATTLGTGPGLRLQPNFVEFLMGYPTNYTSLECPTEETTE